MTLTSPNHKNIRAILIGNPNVGKTSLFNILTNSVQNTGNWAGVTVATKIGNFKIENVEIELVDLPGIYSLSTKSDANLEQQIVINILLNEPFDLIINLIDITNIERNLYLTTQMLDLNKPMICCLNFADKLINNQIENLTNSISNFLKLPIIALSCKNNKGIDLLNNILINKNLSTGNRTPYPSEVMDCCDQILKYSTNPNMCYFHAIKLIEDGNNTYLQYDEGIKQIVDNTRNEINAKYSNSAEIILASSRFEYIKQILPVKDSNSIPVTTKFQTNIDKLVFHKFTGSLIFLFVMLMMFVFSINVGGIFQDPAELLSRAIFIDLISYILNYFNSPNVLTFIISNCIGGGITTVVAFIPIVTALFLFLSFIEESGYLARSAILANGLLKKIGLPGAALIPLIVSFGCNVPAILATRTLSNRNARIKTALMAPFMSCSARLAVYALFCSAFFREQAAMIVLFLYLLGIITAIFTGLILNKFLPTNDCIELILELPHYQWPTMRNLYRKTAYRVKSFVMGAGKTILIIFVIIQLAGSLFNNIDTLKQKNESSLITQFGKQSVIIFKPMGLKDSDWPLAVSLLTGVLAKEVVIGTLSAIYNNDLIFDRPNNNAALKDCINSMWEAWSTLKTNLKTFSITQGFYDLFKYEFENTHSQSLTKSNSLVQKLRENVTDKFAIIAYLIFVLLYFPCISVYSAVRQEIGHKWAIISGLWSTVVAYTIAVLFYQISSLLI